jgi:hypothetical protein
MRHAVALPPSTEISAVLETSGLTHIAFNSDCRYQDTDNAISMGRPLRDSS